MNYSVAMLSKLLLAGFDCRDWLLLKLPFSGPLRLAMADEAEDIGVECFRLLALGSRLYLPTPLEAEPTPAAVGGAPRILGALEPPDRWL